MDAEPSICNVDVVLFDFGGVLADEGFANGLKAIARRHGLDETEFINLARDLIHRTGYITGRGREPAYWQAIRSATGITGDDATLRNEILSRFTPRAWMLNIVRKLRTAGVRVVILSDQTNWLDELNDLHRFFKHFNIVYNSYHIARARPTPRISRTPSQISAPPRTACSSSTTTKATVKGPAWQASTPSVSPAASNSWKNSPDTARGDWTE
jgi:putative hydrolase of the HAD superfamily